MPAEILLTTYQYDTAGNLVRTIDPQGTVNLRQFDEAGRLTKQVENAGASVVQLGEDGSPSLTEDGQLLFEE